RAREYNIRRTHAYGCVRIQVRRVNVSTLVQFSKLVSDSPTSEGIFSLLAQTVVEKCGALHALVFGTSEDGNFILLSSFGACEEQDVRRLDLHGVDSVSELRNIVLKACAHRGYDFRALPLISEAGLFGALVV